MSYRAARIRLESLVDQSWNCMLRLTAAEEEEAEQQRGKKILVPYLLPVEHPPVIKFGWRPERYLLKLRQQRKSGVRPNAAATSHLPLFPPPAHPLASSYSFLYGPSYEPGNNRFSLQLQERRRMLQLLGDSTADKKNNNRPRSRAVGQSMHANLFKTSLALPKTPNLVRELRRYYQFDYLPVGFFSRLIAHLLQVLESPLYWKYGIILMQPCTTPPSATLPNAPSNSPTPDQSRLEKEEQRALLEEIPEKSLLKIHVYGTNPAKLLRLIEGNIENLSINWFKMKAKVFVPCCHCIQFQQQQIAKTSVYSGGHGHKADVAQEKLKEIEPYLFSLEECMRAITKRKTMVYCKAGFGGLGGDLDSLEQNKCGIERDGTKRKVINVEKNWTLPGVRLDILVPDLSMADLQVGLSLNTRYQMRY